MANYNFVIDSHFKPFSFQELVAPFLLYKDAYDKAEEKYYQMADRSNKFKYLREILPADSRARRIYEGFANDLKSKTADFLANGLTMGTRSALTDLRGRIQGEIGMLEDAKTALEEVRRVRDARLAQDPSTKFAVKDLNIDQFLFDQRPNLYSVSTDDLYKRGAAAGLAASQRVYSFDGSRKTMGDYYFDFMEEHGWAPEADRAFRDQMKENKDFKKAMQATLTEKQVYKNITDPDDLEATMDAFLNGWCDGAIHKVTHNLQRNPGKPSWAEEQQAAYQSRMAAVSERSQSLAEQKYRDEKTLSGFSIDKEGNVTFDLNKYGDFKKAKAIEEYIKKNKPSDGDGSGSGGTGSGNSDSDILSQLIPDILGSKNKSEEDKIAEAVRKQEALAAAKEAREQSKKVASATNYEDIIKAGYRPILATIHATGGGSGYKYDDALKNGVSSNIEGWRSGTSGEDVPSLFENWTNAPLVASTFGKIPSVWNFGVSGSVANPNAGDFDLTPSAFKGKDIKVLNDTEIASLAPSIMLSIERHLERLGYTGTPYEIVQVGGNGRHPSYATFVPNQYYKPQ